MTELLKVHGSQNCFFILDQTKLPRELTDDELVALAQQITSKEHGLWVALTVFQWLIGLSVKEPPLKCE